jgi:hypothetical protein
MLYFLALAEAAIFTLAGAVTTLTTAIFFRHFLAFAWRMWLWGSIGFIVGGLLFLAVLTPFFMGGVGIAGAPHTSARDIAITDVVLFGPLGITTLAILFGCWYGWRRARRLDG